MEGSFEIAAQLSNFTDGEMKFSEEQGRDLLKFQQQDRVCIRLPAHRVHYFEGVSTSSLLLLHLKEFISQMMFRKKYMA